MSADKRTVHTDALETLGTILVTNEHRDAIHLGVDPVVAGETLKPGEHIGFLDDGTVGSRAKKKIGIVDPFLTHRVARGEKFWLVVYPRQITSLRHVWTHPDFPLTADLPDIGPTAKDRAEARISAWADELGSSFGEVMSNAHFYASHGEYWDEGERFEGVSVPDWFWSEWSAYTGDPIPEEAKQWGGRFLSCSC